MIDPTDLLLPGSPRADIHLAEGELRPSTVLEIIDCLRNGADADRDPRIGWLELLYFELTGDEPPS